MAALVNQRNRRLINMPDLNICVDEGWLKGGLELGVRVWEFKEKRGFREDWTLKGKVGVLQGACL